MSLLPDDIIPRPYRIATDLGFSIGDGGTGDRAFTLDEAQVHLNYLIEHELSAQGERIMMDTELAGIRGRAMARFRTGKGH